MKKKIKKAAAVFFCVFLIFLILMYIPAHINKGRTSETGASWMKNVDGSNYISEITIPGTHDTAAEFMIVGAFAGCQSLSIPEQLNIGVRFLDIRLKMTDDGFNLVHGLMPCMNPEKRYSVLTADIVIKNCLDFLKANPTETILFMIKEDSGNAEDKFFDLFYEKYIDENWFCENRVPTLDEARGKIVLLRRCSLDETKYDDTNSGLNFSVWPDQSGTDTIEYKSFDMELLSGKTAKTRLNVQDRYKLSPKQKLNAVNNLLSHEKQENTFDLNYFSTGYRSIPCCNAIVMNKYFREGKISQQNDFNSQSIMIFDFISADISEEVFMSNYSDK